LDKWDLKYKFEKVPEQKLNNEFELVDTMKCIYKIMGWDLEKIVQTLPIDNEERNWFPFTIGYNTEPKVGSRLYYSPSKKKIFKKGAMTTMDSSGSLSQ
jgi:hypothetical protein